MAWAINSVVKSQQTLNVAWQFVVVIVIVVVVVVVVAAVAAAYSVLCSIKLADKRIRIITLLLLAVISSVIAVKAGSKQQPRLFGLLKEPKRAALNSRQLTGPSRHRKWRRGRVID
jgi:hypothetical protein